MESVKTKKATKMVAYKQLQAIFQGERVMLTRLLHGSPVMRHSGHLQTSQGV